MIISEYQSWPFYSFRTSAAYRERWWEACYVSLPVVADFIGAAGSVVLFGGPGSGKSVAMAALKRGLQEQTLVVSYQVDNWPNGKNPLVKGGNHVCQIVAAAANEIWHHFQDKPEDYLRCYDLQQEYVIWLFDKYLGRRPLFRFAYRLQQAGVADLEIPPADDIEDIYPTNEKSADVRGNIGELVDLAHTLGYGSIVILVEVNERAAVRVLSDLDALFRLDLLENKEFSMKAVLPESILAGRPEIMQRAGGHFHLAPLSYLQAEIDEMAARHLRAATGGALASVAVLAETAVLQSGRDEVIKLYGRFVPGGWLKWVETLLVEYMRQNRKEPFPAEDAKALLVTFYQQHIRLQADRPRQGVWRGPQFLKLDKQPFEILARLIKLDGKTSSDELTNLAGGSKTNLNTIVSRIREVVEPLPDEKIYIQNRRDVGYWLENGRNR
jgi:hypothetical protein